jgi:hypothetical protein
MSDQGQWQVAGNATETYERALVPAVFAAWAAQVVALADPRPGERVLDVACGTGVVARLVAQRVGPTGKVVGLDLNPGMLTVAASRAANQPATDAPIVRFRSHVELPARHDRPGRGDARDPKSNQARRYLADGRHQREAHTGGELRPPAGWSPLLDFRPGLPGVQHLRGRRRWPRNSGFTGAGRSRDDRGGRLYAIHRPRFWQSVEFLLRDTTLMPGCSCGRTSSWLRLA